MAEKTIYLKVALTYDPETMHAGDPDAIEWFFRYILGGNDRLLLHSSEIGDTVGELSVLEIIDVPNAAQDRRG